MAYSKRIPIKILTSDKTTLWAKAYNDCNKSTWRSGENHVWIRWYKSCKYFKMGLAKDGIPGGGRNKGEIILNVNNVDNPEFIQIVGTDYEPKIQIKYNRGAEICTVTLEPCDETKRTTQYKDCLTPEISFETQKDWVNQVMRWFEYKKSSLKKSNKSTTTPVPEEVVDATCERIIKEEEVEEEELTDGSKKVENKQLSDLTKQSQQIDELSSKEEKEADQELVKAQQQLDEHTNLMKEYGEIIDKGLGITEEPPKTTGGKKSRKNRRTKRRKSNRITKRRKSNRRKKAKKTKKH